MGDSIYRSPPFFRGRVARKRQMADEGPNIGEISREGIDKLLDSHDIPSFYLNGSTIGTSLSDIGLVALIDGTPVCRLHMSFTTAKTIAMGLLESVENLEDASKQPILTMGDIQTAMASREETPTAEDDE